MTDEDVNKLRGVVKAEIETALEPVKKTLKDHTNKVGALGNKVDTLWDQAVKVTGDLDEVKETLELHTVVLKRIEVKVEHNTENTKRVDKRLTAVERHLGIIPPPELTITG